MLAYVVDMNGLSAVDLPEPDDPGPNEVGIEVKAVSLNYRDLLVAGGKYGRASGAPFIAGSDMAGLIVKVGGGVQRFKVGDAVINAPLKHWPGGKLTRAWMGSFLGAAGVNGIMAERVTLPEDALTAMPSHFTFQEGATLPIAGLTAWAGMVTHGRVRPGEWVLLHGTGGVSVFAAQIAQLAGARVLMTTSSAEKAAKVQQSYGVRKTFDYRDENWPGQVRDFTGGQGVDLIIEVAGGDTLARSLKACALNARISLIGILDGYESTINPFDIIGRQVQVRGIYMESSQELNEFAEACESSHLRPHIDRVFPAKNMHEAYDYLRRQEHIGKVVVDWGS